MQSYLSRHTEKGMPNKEVSKKIGEPKNTISTWMKNKDKLFNALHKNLLYIKYNVVAVITKKLTKKLYDWFALQRSHKTTVDGVIINTKAFYAEESIF